MRPPGSPVVGSVGSPRNYSTLGSTYARLGSPKISGDSTDRRNARLKRNIESPKLSGAAVVPAGYSPITGADGGDAYAVVRTPIAGSSIPTLVSVAADDEPSVHVPPEVQADILNGYLYGQIANVGKFAVWWTVFSPLVLALFTGSTYAVGGARTSFNLALFILSPLAGVLAERIAVRRLLNVTTTVRGLMYVVLLPAAWVLLQTNWVIEQQKELYDKLFFVVFVVLVFIDGTLVAFSNVVDIDCGGTSILAKQHGFTVDEATLNKFNSLHVGWFDGSMILLAPLSAFLAVVANKNIPSASDVASILGILAGVFFISTVLSLFFYNWNIPAHTVPGSTGDTLATAQRTCCDEFEDIASNVWSGLKLCWRHKAVRWRLIFLGLETSFEDAMISLVISEFCINGVHGNQSVADGGLLSASIIGVGKFGALLAAMYMGKYWTPPSQEPPENAHLLTPDELHAQATAPYRPLFSCVFLASLFPMLAPVALMLRTQGHETLSLILMFVGAFFFFLFSTAPKIGFATLMQSLAAEADASGKIFGFVAAFLTAADSIVLMAFSAIFASVDLQKALWISCGCIAAHGVIELLFGPALMLQRQEPSAEEVSLVNGAD